MCAWNQPCSVFSKVKVNASYRRCVPSQMKRLGRVTTSGLKICAYLLRILELMPSLAITRSASGKSVSAVDLGLELQLHAQFFAARLQDVEQLLAPDADEAVAAAAQRAALELELDVVPVVEGLLDGGSGGRVPLAHVVHRLVGEHHAPAEGVVGLVALDDRDVVARVQLLHQQPEVQPGRAAPDADDLHASQPRSAVNMAGVWSSML
jgi:hypothetical protein